MPDDETIVAGTANSLAGTTSRRQAVGHADWVGIEVVIKTTPLSVARSHHG
jgi:hypothetical protein